MIKAGGILAIIAGLLGLLAGVVTLFMGGLGAAFATGGASMVVGMGWGGILFSLLVVVYGAIAFAAPRAGATGLALSAIAGMVLGGTLVAILMALALIAAVMVWLGMKKAEDGQQLVTAGRWKGMAAAVVAPVLAAALIGGQVFGSKESASESAAAAPGVQIAQVGQTAHSGQFDVTVRGVRFAETLGRGFGEERATPGTVFVILDVLVRCVDNESRFYTSGDLLVELDGKMLKFDRSETVLGLESPVGSINPMTEKSGYVVYKIPTAAANAPLHWTPGRGFDKVRFALNAPVSGVSSSKSSVELPANASAGGAVADRTDIVGRYASQGGSTLDIRRQGNGQLGISLFAIGPTGNTGEADGSLVVAGNAYTYQNAELDCLLTFRIAGNAVAVTQEGICGFGMNVSAEGTYRKQS
ncbi:MAG: hypothetical protein FD157_2901 [Rhodocyclaceae bacterium]|nr:MAG: hypothetical protein FD157_2901 [Rhodocyclaceae bacterium]TND03848.1 MAG: hypothetical protein FD118_1266 [Rhodocyclaceae bacterium]